MRVNQLALSQAVLPRLAKAGIHQVEQLAEHRIGELLRRPEFSSGVELHELICELHRHDLAPFSSHEGNIQTAESTSYSKQCGDTAPPAPHEPSTATPAAYAASSAPQANTGSSTCAASAIAWSETRTDRQLRCPFRCGGRSDAPGRGQG